MLLDKYRILSLTQHSYINKKQLCLINLEESRANRQQKKYKNKLISRQIKFQSQNYFKHLTDKKKQQCSLILQKFYKETKQKTWCWKRKIFQFVIKLLMVSIRIWKVIDLFKTLKVKKRVHTSINKFRQKELIQISFSTTRIFYIQIHFAVHLQQFTVIN